MYSFWKSVTQSCGFFYAAAMEHADIRLLPCGVAVQHILQGKSLSRAACNHAIMERVHIRGDVLDLGAGTNPSYRPLLDTPRSLTTLDAAAPHADVQADLERVPLDIAAESFDTVLAFNLLEHIYRHAELLEEARRLLRPSGKLYIWVPFLIAFHPDPRDHFRYTEETLLRLLDEAGFKEVGVHGHGGRFTASAALALSGIPTRPARLLTALAALTLDRLYYRVTRVSEPRSFPLGYLAIGQR
jgi:SAM-dependent methyltransferase